MPCIAAACRSHHRATLLLHAPLEITSQRHTLQSSHRSITSHRHTLLPHSRLHHENLTCDFQPRDQSDRPADREAITHTPAPPPPPPPAPPPPPPPPSSPTSKTHSLVRRGVLTVHSTGALVADWSRSAACTERKRGRCQTHRDPPPSRGAGAQLQVLRSHADSALRTCRLCHQLHVTPAGVRQTSGGGGGGE